MHSFRKIWTLAFILLSGVSVLAGPGDGALLKKYAKVYPYTYHFRVQLGAENEIYDVYLIEDSEDDGERASKEKLKALKLIQFSQNKIFEDMKLKYPEYDPATFDAMKAEDLLLEPHSARIIVREAFGKRNIVGTLKLTNDYKAHLQLEDFLGWKFPRPPLHFIFLEGSDPETGKNFAVRPELHGGIVQIQEFTVSKKKVSALLHLVATDFAFHRMESYPLIVVDQALARQAAELTHGLWLPSSVETVHPDTYVLFCDARLVPYYESLGFKKFQEEPIKEKYFVMTTSVSQFRRIAKEHFIFRTGRKSIEENGVFRIWDSNTDEDGSSEHYEIDEHGSLSPDIYDTIVPIRFHIQTPELDGLCIGPMEKVSQ